VLLLTFSFRITRFMPTGVFSMREEVAARRLEPVSLSPGYPNQRAKRGLASRHLTEQVVDRRLEPVSYWKITSRLTPQTWQVTDCRHVTSQEILRNPATGARGLL
jgi:hypothetical protein